MVSKLRTWLQEIKKHPVVTGAVAVALVVVIALIIAEVWLNGTGFDGYYQVTTAHTISGPSAGTVIRTEVYQPGKSLWDWMQLLIIPVAIAVGVWWLNRLQQQRDQQLADQRAQAEHDAEEKRAQAEQEAAEKRAQTERDIALDNQREATLKEYIDKISDLLLEKKLRESKQDDEVRTIARVRTLTVLPRIDGKRKAHVLQFLHEAGLIDNGRSIVDLAGADLSSANLSSADLHAAYLRRANLSSANLLKADLSGAELSSVNLSSAYLRGAELSSANLEGASLEGADLNGAELIVRKQGKTAMSEAFGLQSIIKRTVLENTNLSYADLSNASLSFADLREANLRGAILSGTNLEGVTLENATGTTTEQLNEAYSLKGATMPDGTKHT